MRYSFNSSTVIPSIPADPLFAVTRSCALNILFTFSIASSRLPPGSRPRALSPFSAFLASFYTPLVRETPIVRPFPLRLCSLDTGHPPSRYYGLSDFSPRRLLDVQPANQRFDIAVWVALDSLSLCVSSRPPQVRVSHLHSMQPPHIHYKVWAVKRESVLSPPFGLCFTRHTRPPCTASCGSCAPT